MVKYIENMVVKVTQQVELVAKICRNHIAEEKAEFPRCPLTSKVVLWNKSRVPKYKYVQIDK